MARSTKASRKGRSDAQKLALAAARAQKGASIDVTAPDSTASSTRIEKQLEVIEDLQRSLEISNGKLQVYKKKYYTERRRSARMAVSSQTMKADLKEIKLQTARTRGLVNRMEEEAKKTEEERRFAFAHLQGTITELEAGRRVLLRERSILRKRNKRLLISASVLKERLGKRPRKVRSMVNGTYSRQFRALARYLAATGMAEAKIGMGLKEIAGVLGADLDRVMSKRTVQRCIMEGGVAADIQLAYEMATASKLCYSSDSTSHKRIEYESRHIAMQVIDYSDPTGDPKWRVRSLGVGTSVDHTSETQLAGLKARLHEISELFNKSPLARRTKLQFSADDFAYKLIGTSGDHAADQKKSHRLLTVWKMEVVYQRMGEEAIYAMDNHRVVALLLALKLRQIELKGGQEAWDQLAEEEHVEAHRAVVREVGRQVFENLPTSEQERLSRCIRVGCCMHKDLNCFKAGDKSLTLMWVVLKKGRRPKLLANKENAAVLAGAEEGGILTKDQERALEASKRGGCKLVELAGMICNNSDTKKGQQDLYKIFMKHFTGFNIPFPDVSNTRYGSHGEGAGVIIMYLDAFIAFSLHIRDAKDRPGHTNIEQNFAEGLTDIPTITELVALAIYNVAISRPYMRYVRQHDNLLDLEPFFTRKENLLSSIISNPSIWTQPGSRYQDVYLDETEPEDRGIAVFEAAHKLAPKLPDLDDAVVAIATGSRAAFIERFSEEFREGGGIDKLTRAEREELYLPSTNDVNEGALGAWRLAQRHHAAETLHKFNASKQATTNNTESFISNVLIEDEDSTYLRRAARLKDESKLQSKIREAQIEADKKKVAINRAKEVARLQAQKEREDALTRTGENLVLQDAEIMKLKKDELIRQLDFHRNAEAQLDLPEDTRIPCKSSIKTNPQRIEYLKAAVSRYNTRKSAVVGAQSAEAAEEEAPMVVDGGFDRDYEFDYHDDHF